MITETDWELGLPPYGVPVEVFIRDQVRTGVRDSWDPSCFRYNDCTHPQQNVLAPLDWITAWRYSEQKILDRLMARKIEWTWPKFAIMNRAGGTFYHDPAHTDLWSQP